MSGSVPPRIVEKSKLSTAPKIIPPFALRIIPRFHVEAAISRYIYLANGASQCPRAASDHSRDPTSLHARSSAARGSVGRDAGQFYRFIWSRDRSGEFVPFSRQQGARSGLRAPTFIIAFRSRSKPARNDDAPIWAVRVSNRKTADPGPRGIRSTERTFCTRLVADSRVR